MVCLKDGSKLNIYLAGRCEREAHIKFPGDSHRKKCIKWEKKEEFESGEGGQTGHFEG